MGNLRERHPPCRRYASEIRNTKSRGSHGAGTNIGTEAGLHSPPDGYTLLMISTSTAINATLYPKLNFNLTVWEAFKRVKANQGTAGVDGQSIAEFEADLRNNLYRLWNRLSSGSYFSPPVLRVDIPKADGGMRPLGILMRAA
jgi:hypothetical protein